MGWPTTFAQLAGGTQPLSIFDAMFNQVAQMIAIPCTASGQNSITLSPIANAPILTSYAEFCAFRYKAVATSNAIMSASFLTLPNLPIYLADGITIAGTGNSVLGQEYVLVFSQALNSGAGGFFIEAASIPATTISAGGSASGLVITNNVANPNTQLDVSAQEVVLNNAAGQSLRFTPSGSVGTLNFANNGVNGLDTGAINVNQNYSIWLISNGGVLRTLASLSTTLAGLAFPLGFTFAKLVGIWRTAVGSAQLMGGAQRGTHFQYIQGVAQTLTTSQQASTGATGNPLVAGSLTSISLANFVPPSAKSVDFYMQLAANAGPGSAVCAAPSNSYGAVTATTNPPPISLTGFQTTGAGINTSNPLTAKGTFVGAGPVFYANNLGGGLYIDGYEVNV